MPPSDKKKKSVRPAKSAARPKSRATAAKSKSAPGQHPLLRPHLLDLAPYPPGKPIEEVQREYGLTNVVKLASNENPLGPSPLAVAEMKRLAGEMHLYPDGGGYYLKRKLAAALGVSPEEIILGNGSDEITIFLALAYLREGRNIVTSNYAFIRYLMAARLVNADVRLTIMKDFRHDIDATIDAVNESTALVFLDNPCNPTGAMINKRELGRLLRAVPASTLVVIDEAYFEFASSDKDYPDTLALRRKHPNLIITRTFSKAYGLAGLRIGYGVAPAEVIRDLDRVRPPFNANRLAQAAAAAALDDEAHLSRSREVNERGRSYLTDYFSHSGLAVVPSHANFILVDVSSRWPSGQWVYEELLKRGVIVRPMGGYGLKNHIRISIGRARENAALLNALKELEG